MTHSFSRYYLVFGASYIGVSILFALLSEVISSASTSGTVLVPFVSAMATGSYFLKKENRAPNDAERNRLTWGCFLIFLTITLALLGLAVISGMFADLGATGSLDFIFGIASVFLLIISLIVFFMIRWAFGGMLAKQAERMGEKDNTFD